MGLVGEHGSLGNGIMWQEGASEGEDMSGKIVQVGKRAGRRDLFGTEGKLHEEDESGMQVGCLFFHFSFASFIIFSCLLQQKMRNKEKQGRRNTETVRDLLYLNVLIVICWFTLKSCPLNIPKDRSEVRPI